MQQHSGNGRKGQDRAKAEKGKPAAERFPTHPVNFAEFAEWVRSERQEGTQPHEA